MVILQQFLNGLQLGSLYALIALGYSLVYGVLLLINFAHGDVFMLGAFIGVFGAFTLGLPFVPTLLVAMLLTGSIAVLIERVAYKPLRHASRLSAVITALGVGLMLENGLLALTGANPRSFPRGFIETNSYRLGTINVGTIEILIVVLTAVLLTGLYLLVQHTKWGMAMRAISYDKFALPLMGVSQDRIISLTFLLGGALAAAGGILWGLAYPVLNPYMGLRVGWKAFIAAVVGGIGDIRGAVVGGLLLGFVEIFAAHFFASSYRDLIAFALLLLILVVRPTGIFGVARRQKV
ncbi:MAG TPA: branched-chain amino acid ABC transporter permease [Aggregatilineales bacterium]|nr:branched-chain amino acid ABC transporter permease [Aggregatilineales bacterium]